MRCRKYQRTVEEYFRYRLLCREFEVPHLQFYERWYVVYNRLKSEAKKKRSNIY